MDFETRDIKFRDKNGAMVSAIVIGGGSVPAAVADWCEENIDQTAVEEMVAADVTELKSDLNDIYNPAINSIEKSKNLLSINPAFIGVVNGVTVSWSADGESLIFNGTASASINIPVNGNRTPTANFPAGTYSFSFTSMSGFSTSSPVAVRYNYTVGTSTTAIISQTTTGRTASITFTAPANVYIQLTNGKTYTNARFKLQIESGGSVTAFVRPSGLIDYDARGDIDTYVSTQAEKAINFKSFDITVERYENIEYKEIISQYSSISASNSKTAVVDNRIRFQHMPYSVKCTTASGESSTYFRTVIANGIPIIGTQEIEVYVYTESASSIGTGTHTLRLQGGVTGFSKYFDGALQNGWNKIRFISDGAGTIDWTKSETDFRLHVYTSSEVNVWIGAIYVVKPDKANIIIIDDGPYKTFYDNAYPALSAISVPVTWAIDPTLLGDNTDPDRQLISQEEVNALAYDGISEFSFHNYDGTTMTDASAEDALKDTLNCIRYLQQYGLQPERIWRAAWFHNDCTHPELANEVIDASASYDQSYGVVQFPFPDRYNIPRYAMQGRTTSEVDDFFNLLERQHCTILFYTHGISDNEKDVSTTLLSYYISKISTGVSNGWLNPTTYNRMMRHYRLIQ